MTITERMAGVTCPFMVPLDCAGWIDEDELRRLLEWLIANGVTGLFANGTCGEFTVFTPVERARIVEIAVDQAAGRVLVQAGATRATPAEGIEAIAQCADLGADCVVLLPEYYYAQNEAAVIAYYEAIADRSPLDIVLYNLPSRANEISLPAVYRLARHERIIGIKDSSGSLPRIMSTVDRVRGVRPEFVVLSGSDELLGPALLLGAQGGTLSLAGVAPRAVRALYEAGRAGDVARTRALQFGVNRLIDAVVAVGEFPHNFRAAIAAGGFAMGASRLACDPALAARQGETLARVRDELARLEALVDA